MDLFCFLLESSLFGGHCIVANRQERNLVIACCTRGRGTRKPGGRVDRRNRGLRDRSPRGVINPTLNRDRDHLRAQRQNQTCENHQSQSVGPRRQPAPWTSICKIGIHTLLLEAAWAPRETLTFSDCLFRFFFGISPFITRLNRDSESSRCCTNTAAHSLNLPAAKS